MGEQNELNAYKTPHAFEMAVKSAAKKSPRDTGQAISSFWFDRFLCRVFSKNNGAFILKGGRAMLARTIDARTTRDIDLLANKTDLEEAVRELRKLSEINLDDFIKFEFAGSRLIKTEDEYRSGVNVTFIPLLGTKHLSPISIDLVIDEIPLEGAEQITPVDRLDVKGIFTCDYLVYAIEAALPDKLSGIIETHNGHVSSRLKDLVDIVVYASTSIINGTDLQTRLQRELGARKLTIPNTFEVPDTWHEAAYLTAYKKEAANTGLPHEYLNLENAEKLAQKVFNPVLNGSVEGKYWNCKIKDWE